MRHGATMMRRKGVASRNHQAFIGMLRIVREDIGVLSKSTCC